MIATWLVPALGYAGLGAVFFLPVARRLPDEMLGRGDNLESLWNAWWLSRSLLRLENPWWTDWLFAPEGTPLIWHSLAIVPSTTIALLARVIPTPLAYNVVVIAALPLAGMAAFMLCRHLTRDAAASFAGGAVFMLSPFIVSKTLGHLDLLYGALLPLFYLCLIRAVEDDLGAAVAWRRSGYLSGVSLLILFTASPNVPIFAANLGFLLFCRQVRREPLRPALVRFVRALAPTLLLALPYLLLVAGYAIAYDYPPRTQRDLDYDPELISYLLPFTSTSIYSAIPRGLGLSGLDGIEPAVYLGLVVSPMAAAGLWLRRRQPLVAHLALVLMLFLVLSMGPKLIWQREVVEISGATVYLPFGLWRWLPVLGSVGQAGRYAIIVYLVMAVGVAHAVVWVRERRGARAGWLAAATALLLVAADFAFLPVVTPLPAPLSMSAGGRRVLDPRLGSAETMYQQTLHGRPLVGGYVSRPPLRVLESYRTDPVLGWFFGRPPGPAPSRKTLVARLRELGVGDVLLAPGDPRAALLSSHGFERGDDNGYTVVWSVPVSGP
jgi:hypothetical protein